MTQNLRVGTANIRDILSDADAYAALLIALEMEPHALFLNEWGPNRNHLLNRLEKDGIHKWARGPHGGPVVYDSRRLRLDEHFMHTIAKTGIMGHLPGRRDTLPPSYVPSFHFTDLLTGQKSILNGMHLTAEVQLGKGYRTDKAHAMRVRRHKKERKGLSKLATKQTPHAWVFVTGDDNFDGMTLEPLVSCWANHAAVDSGTLGNRTVDEVYATRHAYKVQQRKNKSDHDAVVASYRVG